MGISAYFTVNVCRENSAGSLGLSMNILKVGEGDQCVGDGGGGKFVYMLVGNGKFCLRCGKPLEV